MTTSADEVVIHRGLNGVYFDRTRTSFIDGKVGKLLYRGYNIHDLAERSTFEETAYLLLYGDLPTSEELRRFDQELKAARSIPAGVRIASFCSPRSTSPSASRRFNISPAEARETPSISATREAIA